MKICFFANAASIHTERWCKHFAGSGHEIHLISFSDVKIDGVHCHFINSGDVKEKGGNWQVLLQVGKVRKVLKSIKPDVLHAHYATSYGISGAFSGFRPLIITCLGTDVLISPKQSLIIRLLLRFAFKRASLVTVMADHMLPHVLELSADKAKTKVLPFGVDNQVFYPMEFDKSDEDFVVLSTRNLEKLYNIHDIIKAIALVKEKYPNVKLKIVGHGSLKEELEQLGMRLGLENNVQFLGKLPQPEIAKEMNRAHAFVSMSSSDGNNISLNEAMACGTFSVASNIPANTQWIHQGINGFLVEIHDVNGIAECLLRIKNEYSTLVEKAKPLNEHILQEKGIWQNNMEKMEGYYRDILKKK